MSDNVHQYDGKLRDDYIKLRTIDDKYLKTDIAFSQCLDEMEKFNSHIISKIRLTPNDNYDSINDIDFSELCPRVWKFNRLLEESDNRVFFEQIDDMKTGLCPQGRTTRMFQIYNIWIDELIKYMTNIDSVDKDIRKVFDKLLIGNYI